jgi:hypothetical protein
MNAVIRFQATHQVQQAARRVCYGLPASAAKVGVPVLTRLKRNGLELSKRERQLLPKSRATEHFGNSDCGHGRARASH